ncbi:hypothetical protein CHUAL_003017 [Chamberlinius hualienensis]
MLKTYLVLLNILLSHPYFATAQRSQKNVEAIQIKPQIGLLFETCSELNGTVPDDVQLQLNKTGVVSVIWRSECENVLTFTSTLASAVSSDILGLMVVARRDFLDVVYSATYNSSLKVSLLSSVNTLDLVASQQSASNDTEYGLNGKLFWQITADMLKEIIVNWNWRNIYIYADQVLNMEGKKLLQEMLQPFWLSTSIKLIQNPQRAKPNEFIDQLLYDQIGLIEAKQIVILCNEDINAEIAREASSRNLLTGRYQWLFFSVDSKSLYQETRLRFDSNVLIARVVPWTNLTNYIWEMVKDLKSKIPLSFSLPSTTGKGNKLQQANVYQDEQDAKPLQPLSLELLRLQLRRRRERPDVTKVGQWSSTDGVTVIPYDVLSNFDGIHIPISTIDSAPYVITTIDSDGKEMYSGYLVDLLKLLSKILNFRYNLTRIPNNSFGDCVNASLCDGLTGALVRKEVEIGLANFVSTVSKQDYIDFSSHAVDQGGVSILINRPRRTDAMAIWAYFRPFAWPVAVLVGVSYIVFALLLHLTMALYLKLKWSIQDVDNERKAESLEQGGLSRCTVMAIQGFSQQGIDVIPNNSSAKIVYAVMWVFSVIIMSAYNSNLISYFTVTDVDWPFRTLEELVQKDDYRLVMIKGTTYLSDFEKDKESVLYKVYKRVKKNNFRAMTDDLDSALERVKSGQVALLHSKRILEFVESKSCNFTVLNVLYLSAPITIAFQKDSQFTKPISSALLRLEESGLVDNLKARWWPPVFDCDDYNGGYKSVSVWAITSLLTILASGMIIAAVFLIIESIIFKKRAQLRVLSAHIRRAINVTSARLFSNDYKDEMLHSTAEYRKSKTPRYVKRFLKFTTEDAVKSLYNNEK